jgi:hypothetical protein
VTKPQDPSPPVGTIERIRVRAGWAVALFGASVVPAIVGIGIIQTSVPTTNVATPFAFGFWVFGLMFAVGAAIPTLRYWDDLPIHLRWFGALPLLCVSLFLSVAVVAVTIRG